MNKEIKDGGPAFPNRGYNTPQNKMYDGMSLRDWFAWQALAVVIASHANPNSLAYPPEVAARESYSYADAMLKAREQG